MFGKTLKEAEHGVFISQIRRSRVTLKFDQKTTHDTDARMLRGYQAVSTWSKDLELEVRRAFFSLLVFLVKIDWSVVCRRLTMPRSAKGCDACVRSIPVMPSSTMRKIPFFP